MTTQTQTVQNDPNDWHRKRANRSSNLQYCTRSADREPRNPQPIDGPTYVPSATDYKPWPPEPEGFEYRFCLPSSPVLHFLRELTSGALVPFRIQRGGFVRSDVVGIRTTNNL
jgi:hypothetical protein